MRTALLHSAVALAFALAASLAQAQSLDPTPETTPPIELDGSIPTDAELQFDGTTWFITDELGFRSGESLFHSFGRFDVPGGQVAEFSAQVTAEHPVVPERVFARVTWGEPSDIEGTLRSTIPDADLYLINPAGVNFVGSAKLEVQGSFHVTSAGQVDFGEGHSFTASASDPPPVLTWQEPTSYGFLPEGGKPIKFGLLELAPMSVRSGETLAAIGGEVQLRGGGQRTFVSPGSRIALVAAGPGVVVPADLTSFDPSQVAPEILLGAVDILGSRVLASSPAGSVLVRGGSFSASDTTIGVIHNGAQPPTFAKAVDIAVRGDISITGGSTISAVGTASGGSGDLWISGQLVDISANSEIVGATTGSGAGGNLWVRADALQLTGDGRLRSETRNTGAGGTVDIEVGELALATGGRIVSDATGAGPGGQILIDASRIDATDAGYSTAGTVIRSMTTHATGGDAGAIHIDADEISLRDGAQIFSSTTGGGATGIVDVDASRIELSGLSDDPSSTRTRASLIETRALPGSTGAAGQLVDIDPSEAVELVLLGVDIDADTVHVVNGAELGTATQGMGTAGDLLLHAADSVVLEGGPSGPATLQSRATASITDSRVGDGGRVRVETPSLMLVDGGQITSATTGTGDAGRVELDVGRVELRGRSSFGESGIFAQTLAAQLTDGGDAGAVRIDATDDVVLADGGRILVETTNAGAAGRVEIDTHGRLILDDAAISARASPDSTAASGSIGIWADQGVFLSNGSVIGSRSFGNEKAGTIFIDAGPLLEMQDSELSTESITLNNPGGGLIEVVAADRIVLTDSTINTSVRAGGGDGGNVSLDPELVLLNRSSVLARATDGNGGSIRIVAGSFVASSDSVLDASSETGIDGTVVIESPESELNSERAQPAQEFLDAAGLMRTACGASASQSSSFVVERVAGLPATPEGPLPAPLWEALGAHSANAGSGGPALAGPVPRLPAAALAGGCAAQEGSG